MYYRYLVVWHNLNNNSFYFKFLKHNYNNYYVGFVNQYNHEIILIQDVSSYITISRSFKPNYKRIIIKKLISILERNI